QDDGSLLQSIEDLTCPVCCDIFRDPVLLSCSHSFCRSCLKKCWDTRPRECPVCRRKASKCPPLSNLALRNVCEALQQVRRQNSLEEQGRCSLHGEKLKLFCLADEQPICVVCQASKLHKNHDCSPVEEALLDFRLDCQPPCERKRRESNNPRSDVC
uniref:RING-type domain-containing protein n=1 Tax=Poecilia latipinna TaxID=48699 RepID=A0A3B3TMU1_9TELE